MALPPKIPCKTLKIWSIVFNTENLLLCDEYNWLPHISFCLYKDSFIVAEQ